MMRFIELIVLLAMECFGMFVQADMVYVGLAADNSSNRLGRIGVIDTDTNTLVTTIPLEAMGKRPHDIVSNPLGTRLYVTIKADRSVTSAVSDIVSVIDTSNNSIIYTIDVGNNPTGIAINTEGTRVYVTNYDDGTVSVINTSSHEVVATVPVGSRPNKVAVNPNGTRVYVVNNDGKGNGIQVIDTTTNNVVATVTTGDSTTHDVVDVVVNPTGTFFYVTNFFSNTVSVIDSNTYKVVATIPTPMRPANIEIDPDGKMLFVTHYSGSSSTVSVIDTATNSVTTNIAPYKDGDFLYLGDIAIAPNGMNIYVNEGSEDVVRRINTSNNAITTMPAEKFLFPEEQLSGIAVIKTPPPSQKNKPPVASFTTIPDNGTVPLRVMLDYGASSDPDGTIINYDWKVNGQPISVETAGQQKFITLNNTGIYTVTLTVTDNGDLTSIAQKIVVVNSVPPPPSTGNRTLILTNYQKLVELYGSTEADRLMTNLNSLASHSSVQGQVIRVESDPTVAAAYRSRDSSYDDRNRGNAVAEAIKQVILTHWDNSNEALQYLVFIGDDRVIPFYRIVDGTYHPDPMTLTDDFYLDHPPYNTCENCANPQIFIPDIAGGRLVENPSQIIGMITAFIANQRIYLGNAVIVGWDFLVDGAQSHCQALQKDAINSDCSLISQTWSAQNFKQQVFEVQHDASVINLHADYSVYQAPTYELVRVTDLLNSTIDFTGKLFYSTGCHSGQNVDSDVDWPEAYATKHANYVANTGFGWGGGGVVLSEKLIRHLSEELTTNTTLGAALMQAKQEYFAEVPELDKYDEKITAEATLYGLPMYQVESPPSQRRSTDDIRRSLRSNSFLPGGAERTELSYDWPASTPVTTEQGNFYTLAGKITSNDNEPILPSLANDISRSDKALHGVVFRGGNYTRVNTAPPLQHFITTTGYQTPERIFISPGWYPSKFFTGNTIKLNNGDKQTVIATAGQYNPNLNNGQQRIFNNMDFDAYYHTANDWTPPAVYLTDSKLQSNLATIGVTASDAAGIAEIVVAYTDGQSLWNSVNLTASGATWSGNFAANADTEFFVQAVDSNGNVAVNDNDGKYFTFDTASTPKLPSLGSGKSISPDGKFANSSTSFAGGASSDKVNYQTYLTTSPSSTSNNLTVKGRITVDPADVGKQADLLYVAGFENQTPFDGGADTVYFTMDESGNLSTLDLYNQPSIWMNQLAAKPFKHNVTLQQEMVMDTVDAGQLLTKPSVNYYFMGYRLQNGTLVYTSIPIIVNVQ
jgi:YVTN family beta-propeller protein